MAGKYRVEDFLAEGSNGEVFSVSDAKSTIVNTPLVVKVQPFTKFSEKEIYVLRKMQKKSKSSISFIVDWGLILLADSSKLEQSEKELLNDNNSNFFSYIVMPRYGTSLEQLFAKRKFKFTAP